MKSLRLFLVGAIASLAVVTSGQMAQAAVSPDYGLQVAAAVFAAANPHAAYLGLSPTDKAAFDAVETPAATVSTVTNSLPASVTAAAAFSGCWSRTMTWEQNAVAGNTLFTFWQATKVCASAGKVSSITVYNFGSETSTPGWYKDGATTTAKYNAVWEGRGLVQVRYSLGVNGWNVQHLEPCGQLRLNADGVHWASSASCNLN